MYNNYNYACCNFPIPVKQKLGLCCCCIAKRSINWRFYWLFFRYCVCGLVHSKRSYNFLGPPILPACRRSLILWNIFFTHDMSHREKQEKNMCGYVIYIMLLCTCCFCAHSFNIHWFSANEVEKISLKALLLSVLFWYLLMN